MKSSTDFVMGFLRSPTASCEKNASLDSPKENRTLTTFVIDLKRLTVELFMWSVNDKPNK